MTDTRQAVNEHDVDFPGDGDVRGHRRGSAGCHSHELRCSTYRHRRGARCSGGVLVQAGFVPGMHATRPFPFCPHFSAVLMPCLSANLLFFPLFLRGLPREGCRTITEISAFPQKCNVSPETCSISTAEPISVISVFFSRSFPWEHAQHKKNREKPGSLRKGPASRCRGMSEGPATRCQAACGRWTFGNGPVAGTPNTVLCQQCSSEWTCAQRRLPFGGYPIDMQIRSAPTQTASGD